MAKRTVNQASLQDRLSRSFRRIPAEDVPRIFRLRLDEIEPSHSQPRKHIDQDGLRELAASIERHGLIQPITVRRRDDGEEGYLLVAGERRFRAHEMLGREEILAIVTLGAADEISLIENIQRQDLHPLDEAAAYHRMMQSHQWTQEQLAEAVGKARTTITNTLKLNALAGSIKAECEQRFDVSKSLLFEIARLDDWQAQERLWTRMRAGATVRHARAATGGLGATNGPTGRSHRPDPLKGLASSSRRFLRQLEIAENGDVRDLLKKEIKTLRRDVENLLGKLERSHQGKAGS